MVSLEAAGGGVELGGSGVEVERTMTDSSGKFIFQNLAPQVYLVRAHHPGYQDAVARVDVMLSPRGYAVIELRPSAGKEAGAMPREGSVANISVGQLELPAAAQKELLRGQKLLMEDKDAEGSIHHLRKAIEIYPSFAQTYVLLGAAYMETRRWEKAQATFQQAIQLNEKLAAGHLGLGVSLSQQRNFAAAEKPLLRGLELDPQAVEGHYELGTVYWATGRWQEAEPHARKALGLRPDFAAAHLLMGNVLLRKRDAAAALREFKEYLRLEPNGPFAPPTREVVAKIEQGLATPR